MSVRLVTRDRVVAVLISFILLCLAFLIFACGYILTHPISSVSEQRHQTAGDPLECKALKVWYNLYNEEYFGGVLPKNTVVTYGGAGGAMAVTTKREGIFYITLEEKYTLASNVSHLTLLHESCHVLTWNEFDEHGKRWYDCMHRLYEKGAMEGLL